jgi:hypothetical protein
MARVGRRSNSGTMAGPLLRFDAASAPQKKMAAIVREPPN